MFTDEAREVFAEAEFEGGPKNLRASKLPLSHQEKAIAELHETIDQLASMLKPVLTPVQVTEENVGLADKEIPAVSPLAEQMEANNRGISRASANLRGLMKRLEV